jgi:hypothetical protein
LDELDDAGECRWQGAQVCAASDDALYNSQPAAKCYQCVLPVIRLYPSIQSRIGLIISDIFIFVNQCENNIVQHPRTSRHIAVTI